MSCRHRFVCGNNTSAPFEAKQVERSSRTPDHLFLCQFLINNEIVRRLCQIKTRVSCTRRFVFENDAITPFKAK